MNPSSRPEQGKSPGQSLAKARLRRHADYLRAYAAARKRQSASMSWFLASQAPQTLGPQIPGAPAMHLGPRVGLTVGKVLGKATQRNRIKRRMREALRRHVDLLPKGCDLIFHPRRVVLTMEFAQLEAEIVRILEQARTEASRGFKSPAAALRAPGTPAP
ncbi:MAG: ribonuclease P protein component [Terracidiphilus sp.]|nr:ribonuclease P protein component [Terracidiphilus sp.]